MPRKAAVKKNSVPLILKGIEPEEVFSKYYLPLTKNNKKVRTDITNDVVQDIPINDLLHEKSKKYRMYIDPHKCKRKIWINMIDNRFGALPNQINKPCWWCRATFRAKPIGCPMKYHSDNSEGMVKDLFIKKLHEYNLPTDTTDFFETEGVFCSFPCVKSYIMEQLSITKGGQYSHSLTLLTLLYKRLTGKVAHIPVSFPWEIQKEWTGHLTTEEARASVGKLWYEKTPTPIRPFMYNINHCFKESRLNV